MAKYLWDLNLDEIPLSWENVYQDALANYPDGELIPSDESWDDIQRNYFFHSVKYRQLIIETFNKYKTNAIELMGKKHSLDFKDFINQIIKTDVILYNLLFDWICDEDSFDISSFNPNNFYNNIVNYEFYFKDNSDLNGFEQIESLKLINFICYKKPIIF
jgi:hypothetical protein